MTNLRLIALTILFSLNTFAAENISYSGRLVTPAGTPVVGPVNIKFDIVVDSDVKCTLTKSSVPLSNGVFNVSLDYGTTCTQFDGTLSKTIEAAYYNDKIPYIRVTDTTNTKTYPDQPIAAVPLAIHALSGGSEGYNLDLEYTCADGEILKMNSSNLFQCTSDLEGVTGVTAGTGLNGGTITSTGTIDINVGTGSGQIPQLDGSGKLAVSTIPNLPGSIITSGTIDEAYLPTADASNNGKLTSSDWNMFNNKQDDLGTGSAGQYLANGPAWATLNTQAVAEHSSNLYFTDARAKAATVADAISDAVTDVAPSQNAVFDALATKADANGNADIVADSITVDTQGGVNLAPYGAAAGNTSEIRFYELSGNGSNYTGFKSPDLLSSDIIYTLPPNGGTNNYVLSLTNSVTGELGWMDVSTASGLSNTGDVIINADSDSDNTGEVVFQTKGTDRVVIDNDGNVGIGVGVPTAKFDTRLTSSDTASGNIKLNRGLLYARPTSASSSTLFASESVVSTGGGTGQDLQKLFSSRNLIYHSDANGGTVNSAFASSSVVINKDIGTITNAIGARGRIANTSTGTIDTAYAFRAEIENSGGGTINNAYGLYVYDVPDATSSEYGLYQAGSDDLNYFAGNVGVGVLAPNELLTVEGVLSLRESAAPSVTANYGKIYVKTDGKAYFKNDAGTEFDITDNGDGGTVTSVATGTGLTGGPITTTGTISIANDGVTATQLADDAVDTAAIVDANVTTAKLADDAVTSAKLAAGAVDSNALGANSVSSSNIVDGTIVNADISGTAAIDYTKLDIANGEIPQAKVNSLTSDLASKLPLAGGTMTGDVAMGDNDITGLTSLGLNGATLGVVTVQAPLSVTSYTWQFPSTSGTSGQALFTDGTGATSWGTVNTSTADGHSLDAADGTPTDVVYVDNSGNVGIGTTSPSSKLEVQESTYIEATVRSTGASAAIKIGSTAGQRSGLRLESDQKLRWTLQKNDVAETGSDAGSDFNISRWDDAGNWIDHSLSILRSNGFVGIGTSFPSSKLEVQEGDLSLSRTTANTTAFNISRAAGQFAYMNFQTNGSRRWHLGVSDQAEGGANSGSDFFINRADDSGNFIDTPFAIDRATGNIGIGTSDPKVETHIHDPTVTNSYLKFTHSTSGAGSNDGVNIGLDSANSALVWNFENSHLKFGVNNTEAMRLTNLGSLGLGTTSPQAKLHLSSSNSYTPAILIENTNTDQTSGYLLLSKSPSDNTITAGDTLGNVTFQGFDTTGTRRNSANISSNATSQGSNYVAADITFSTTNNSGVTSQKMVISSEGNLGIGVGDPDAKLEVNGQIKVTGGSPGAGKVLTSDASGLASWQSVSSAASSDTLDGLDSTQFLRSDAADTKDGYLGINYNSGSNNFLLYPNDGRGNMHMYWNSTGTSSPTAKETGAGFDLAHSTGNTLMLQTAPSVSAGAAQTFSNTMVWTGDGDVGIGKNNPSTKLDVNGTVTATAFSGDLSGTASNADTLDSIDSSAFLRSNVDDTYAGGVMTFETSAGQVFGASGGRGPLQVLQSTANADALMTFHVSGDYATYFGLDGSTNELSVGGWSMGGPYKIWHEGNDGTGSGLSSDYLDGIDSAGFLRSNTDDTMNSSLTITGSGSSIAGSSFSNGWLKIGNSSVGIAIDSNEIYGSTALIIGTLNDAAINMNTSNLNLNDGSVTASSFLYTSDERLKENIQPLENPLERVENLRGVSFNWKESGKRDIGFIAQEVEDNEKELVTTSSNEELGIKDLKAVKYGNITALLVEAVKEIKNKLDSLFDSSETNTRSIASLEKENKELKEKLQKQKSDFERKLEAQEERLNKLEKALVR